ncbi:alpha/beta fold hydrolase [Streptomyces sp. NPDC004647]|uniref:alpha/beta fold hydrolase n=1 Tax=Streptomyces sp. NPDC004647 TaxID=3154671 RepID=UPI0033B6D621
MGSKVGSFTSEAARSRFLETYDRAMQLWPRPHSERDVTTRFGSTRVFGYGSGDGRPIVLLPGRGGSPAVWAANVATFGKHHRVLGVDIIGGPGRSEQTAPILEPRSMAAWLDEVLEGLGLREAHLVGASQGGWIALNQAVHSPGRLASISLLDPVRALAPFKPGFLLGAILTMVSGSDRFRRRYFASLMGGVDEEDESAQRRLDLLLAGVRSYRSALMPPQEVGNEELRSVSTPTLVLLGERSTVHDARKALARAQDFMPAAQAEIVPGAGHTLPADVVNARVPEFIRSAETRTSK